MNLKKCPFCTGKATLTKFDTKTIVYRIVCIDCLAGTTGCLKLNDAIKLWNQRGEKLFHCSHCGGDYPGSCYKCD